METIPVSSKGKDSISRQRRKMETEGLERRWEVALCLIACHRPTSRPSGDQTSNFSWKRLAGKQTQMTAETVRDFHPH